MAERKETGRSRARRLTFTGRGVPPVSVAWKRGPAAPDNYLNYHREPELQFIKRGTGAYLVEGRRHPFRKNTLLLIRPNQVHRIIASPALFIERATVIFDPGFLDRWPDPAFAAFSTRVLLPEREATAVEVALNGLDRELRERGPFHREVARAELEKVLWLARRSGRRPAGRRPEHPKLRGVIEYLDANFAADLGLEEVAARFALSAGHLSRTFKRYTGLGLKQYVLQRRIVAAKRLLEEAPGLKVAAVSRRVGFHDFAVFNRDFKLITGLTPSAYRKNSHPAVKK